MCLVGIFHLTVLTKLASAMEAKADVGPDAISHRPEGQSLLNS